MATTKKPAAKKAAPAKKAAAKATPAEPKNLEGGQQVMYNPSPEEMETYSLPVKTPGSIEQPQGNGQFLLKLRGARGDVRLGAFYSATVKPRTFQLA